MISNQVLMALPVEERAEFTKRCKVADDLFNHFASVLEKRLAAHKAGVNSQKNYELASWPYYQADSVGYTRGLEEVINLLKFED